MYGDIIFFPSLFFSFFFFSQSFVTDNEVEYGHGQVYGLRSLATFNCMQISSTFNANGFYNERSGDLHGLDSTREHARKHILGSVPSRVFLIPLCGIIALIAFNKSRSNYIEVNFHEILDFNRSLS